MELPTWLIILLIAILVALIIRSYIYGKDNYWPNYNVHYLDINSISPFYKRFSMSIPLAELDLKIYSHFKGLPYAGTMEMRTPVLYILDMDLIKQILVKDFESFPDRRELGISKTEPVLGRMLTELKGKEWKNVRSIISPTFTTGKIKLMFQFFNTSGHHLSNYLNEHMINEGNIIDFQDTFGRYTLDVIASVAFGIQTDTFKGRSKGQDGSEGSLFREMAKKLNNMTLVLFIKFIMYVFVPKVASALELSLSEPTSMKFFTTIAHKAIEERRVNLGKPKGEKRNDFLQLLVEAQAGQLEKDQEGESQGEIGSAVPANLESSSGNRELEKGRDVSTVLDDNTVIGQCLLFFSAGSDTTESLLTFATYSLAINPDIQEMLVSELDDAMQKHNGDLSYETILNLEYLDKVVCETLRMYPPAVAAERTCGADYVIPGTKVVIPKGAMVHIPIHGIHHDEKHYPNPEKFDPENFSVENKSRRHPYAFLPFGQGPRSCIAMRFALTEAKAALAHLIYNYQIEPCEKTQIPIKFDSKSFVLKPSNGMFLKFSRRQF